MPPNDADIIIAGAGLSGLSLATQLQQVGYAGRVLILDRRVDFSRDQRWCSWGPIEPSLANLAAHSWSRWQVIGEDGSHRFHLPERPYVEFHAARLLGALAGQLARSPNFELRLGAEIVAIVDHSRWGEVQLPEKRLRAKWVIEARGDGALTQEERAGCGGRNAREVWLWQSFVGFTVQASVAAFEPGCVTLMDFRTPQSAAAEFFYVLPYSATRALVECTVVDHAIWPLARYREHLEDYLARLGLGRGQWRCESEEVGAIPMTSHVFPSRASGAVARLGVAAGAAKPSTGYGFARARRQARAMAEALLQGLPGRLPQPGARSQMLDTILLDVVAAHPGQFQRGMLRMFARVDAAAIVRFLSEESSLVDDARVASVVGSMKFAEAAVARYAKFGR